MKKFNKDKYLKKLKYKRILQKYSKYFYIGIPCILCLILSIYFTYSKFFVSTEEEVIRTTVGEFIYGDMVLSYTLDGVAGTNTFPKQNTGVEGTSVTCDNEATAIWDNSLWSIKMTNMGNGSRVKCKVAFTTQETKTISGITFNLNTFSPDFSKSACSDCESKEAGVFAAEDDYGTRYYYRGSVENNYVSFAGLTWRIIRINGDGSVRIILNDTAGTSAFNNLIDDNTYVGYMYGTPGSSTYEETHKNINDSIMKKNIDVWYENNLKANYVSYLADAGFCNDRVPLQKVENSGTSNVITYYVAYGRIVASIPTLKCQQLNDLFTTSSAINGNKALKYPIATITADEAMLAGIGGGVFDGSWTFTKGSTNYLNISKDYWTMTPTGGYIYYENKIWLANEFSIDKTNRFDDYRVLYSVGIRPVINLKSDVIKYGTGTSSDPYRVTEN